MTANPSAQLRFLTDAAYLLRQSAPETSAYLMNKRTDLVAQQAVEPQQTNPVMADAYRQRTCTCCGHVMVAGRDGTTLKIQPGCTPLKKEKRRARPQQQRSVAEDGEKKRSRREEPPHAGIQKIYNCGFCSKDTRIVLPPPAPLPKRRKAVSKAIQDTESKAAPTNRTATATGSTITSATPTTQGNASSKKRAKTRKAGLLAMLDKDKNRNATAGSSLFSLSFDDFRKK